MAYSSSTDTDLIKSSTNTASEFSLIDRLVACMRAVDERVVPTSFNNDSNHCVVLGVGDDCALLNVPTNHRLVVTTDTSIENVHFPDDTPAHSIGHKSLAVNLSDLAAMGAHAMWVSLAMTLPKIDDAWLAWLDEFATGFAELASQYNVQLVGGDTTRGALSITITAMGILPNGQGLLRSGARLGDDVYVTGTLGQAGYELAERDRLDESQRVALNYPQPRLALGQQLLPLASAAIDVSDGLLQDLGHILQASSMSGLHEHGLGAQIYTQNLPISPVLDKHVEWELAQLAQFGDGRSQEAIHAQRLKWALSAGDEYELCFTAPVAQRDAIAALSTADVPITRIGHVVAHTPESGAESSLLSPHLSQSFQPESGRVQIIDQARGTRSNYPFGFQHF